MINSDRQPSNLATRIPHWARRLGLLAATALSSLAPAAAGSASAQDIVELTVEQPAVGGTLFGNSGGTFRKFYLDYPGGGPVIIVTLDVNNPYDTMGNLIGFEVFGPEGLVTRGEPPTGNRTSTRARAAFSRPNPGRYMIQTYSYVPGKASNFTLTVSGLDGGAGITGSTNPASAPLVQANTPALAGSLVGNTAGAVLHFLVNYAGGDTELRITLTYSPPYRLSDRAVRLQLYDGINLVAESSEVERTTSTSIHRLSYSSHTATTYGLQLVNYAPANFAIDYSIEITGMGAEPVAVEGNTTPDQAYMLSAETPSVSGTVQGTTSGSFAYFLISSAGDRQLRITLTTAKEDRAADANVGLNLYLGSSLQQQNAGVRDAQGRFGANVVITSSTPNLYGIQVYNYNNNVPLQYRVNVVGY